MSVRIFTSDFQAVRQAKADFANILGIHRDSVRVAIDEYWSRKYGWTTCVCGETRCVYYQMINAGPRQIAKIEKHGSWAGGVFAYGVCPHWGDKF